MKRETKVLEDGTHWNACGHGYKPLAPEERTYAVRRPADPRAVRYGSQWFVPLALVSDDERAMPETVPDDETLLHRASCRCEPCRRPQAAVLWRRRSSRLKSG